MDEIKMWIAVSVMVIVMFAIGMCAAVQAPAAPGWEGRPLICDPVEFADDLGGLQRCKKWIEEVKTPVLVDGEIVISGGRCCGEADAFVTDAFEVENGETYAIITRPYPARSKDDGDGGSVDWPAFPDGTRIHIPKDKMNPAYLQGGNPTGHGVVFMDPQSRVFCYFTPPLT